MPIITFKCNNPDCDNEIVKLFNNWKEVPSFLDCGQCGVGKLERMIGAVTKKIVMKVDPGNYSKEVEVLKEIVEKEEEKIK